MQKLRRLLALGLAIALLAGSAVTAFAEGDGGELPFPETGVLTENDDSEYGKLTVNGFEVRPVYIKLYAHDPKTLKTAEEPVKTVFVNAGESVTVSMPQGEYVMRYCTGETWHGEEAAFGERQLGATLTAYAESGTVYKFYSRGKHRSVNFRVIQHGEKIDYDARIKQSAL